MLGLERLKELPAELKPPDPESPRGRILEAARKLFAEEGLDATSTRAIAEAAGVNLAMIHYYFGSKEKLYERVLAGEFLQFRNTMMMLVSPGAPPEEIISNMPVRAMAIMRKNPLWAVLLRRELAGGGTHLMKAFRNLGEFGPLGLREFFNQIYERAAESGRIRRYSSEALRECIIALMFGTMVMQPFFLVLFERDLKDEKVWQEWAETTGSLLKYGLLPERENNETDHA